MAEVLARKTADQITNTTAFADVTDLTFPVTANTTYHFRFVVPFTTGVNHALRLAINGPTSPASLRIGGVIPSTTTTVAHGSQSAYDTSIFNSGTAVATPRTAVVEGVFVNGPNAGTLALRFANEATEDVTVFANSHGVLESFASAPIEPAALSPAPSFAPRVSVAPAALSGSTNPAARASFVTVALTPSAEPRPSVSLRVLALLASPNPAARTGVVPTAAQAVPNAGPAIAVVPAAAASVGAPAPSWVALPSALAPTGTAAHAAPAVPAAFAATGNPVPVLPAGAIAPDALVPVANASPALALGVAALSPMAGPVPTPSVAPVPLAPAANPSARIASVAAALEPLAAAAPSLSLVSTALAGQAGPAPALAAVDVALQALPNPEPSVGAGGIQPAEFVATTNPNPSVGLKPAGLLSLAIPRPAHATAAAVLAPLAMAASVALAIIPPGWAPLASPSPTVGLDTRGPVVAVFAPQVPQVLADVVVAPAAVTSEFDDFMSALICRRGDTWEATATFTFAAGNLTGCKVWLTVKKRTEDPDAQALVQIDTDQGDVAILTGTTASFIIPADVTATFPPGVYLYDVQVRLPSSKSYTADSGSFTVQPDVTQAT